MLKHLLSSISIKLASMCEANSQCLPPNSIFELFHLETTPDISVHMYMRRIIQYFECSPSVFVVLMVYLRKCIEKCSLLVTRGNVHRLCGVLAVLAVKYLEDDHCSNKYYAQVVGLDLLELNLLEALIFKEMNFDAHVQEEEFYECFFELLERDPKAYGNE